MKPNPVGWFEIYVKDMARARAFYEAVLGTRLEPLSDPGAGVTEMVSFPMERDAQGAAGALVKMEGIGGGGANSVIVYFTCDDCAVEAGRVEKNGGEVIKPKFSIGQYGHIALVSDSEGTVFGLHSMK